MRLVAQRIVDAIIVVVLVTMLASGLIDLIPGSATGAILGPGASPASIAALTRQLGLNKPLWDRYYIWMDHAVHGNLGTSIETNQSVTSMLSSHLPVTLEIAIATLIISLLVAIPIAMFCAVQGDGWVDRIVRAICSGLFSIPTFVGCVLLTLLLSVKFRWLPSYGWVSLSENLGGNIAHAALPVIVLSIAVTPLFLRVLRADLIAVLREDYILSARARGLPSRYIMTRHALRPGSLSIFTLSGLLLGYLVGGSIVLETYFAIPGIGWMVSQAVEGKDVTVVQGVVVVMAIVYVVVNALVDFGYRKLDPRVAATS